MTRGHYMNLQRISLEDKNRLSDITLQQITKLYINKLAIAILIETVLAYAYLKSEKIDGC